MDRDDEGEEEEGGTARERERERGVCAVLYKPMTTVRLPLLCRELITNPIARPTPYLHPHRALRFPRSSRFSRRLPIGHLSARSIGQDFLLNSHLR